MSPGTRIYLTLEKHIPPWESWRVIFRKYIFFLRHLNWCGLKGLEFSFFSNIPPANPGLSWSPRSPACSWLALPSSPEPHLSASHCHHDNPLEARQEVATWTSLWKAVWQSPSLTPSFLCSLLTAICCLFKASQLLNRLHRKLHLFILFSAPPKGSTLFWAFSPLRPRPLRQRWWHRKSLYFCGASDGFCSLCPCACACVTQVNCICSNLHISMVTQMLMSELLHLFKSILSR